MNYPSASLSFSDVIQSLEKDFEGLGKIPIDSVAEAARLVYRVLLGRLPDHLGLTFLHSPTAPRNRQDLLTWLFLSQEFAEKLPLHLTRLRGVSDHPVTWHLHLPRTGGTKVAKDWRDRGGFVIAMPLRPRVWSQQPFLDVLRQLLDFREALTQRRPLLVTGHVTISAIDGVLRPQDTIVATVRDPVQRALSLFRYARAMALGGTTISHYPDHRDLSHFAAGWRATLAAHHLDAEMMTFRDFLDSDLCRDDQYDAYFSPSPDVPDLGDVMRASEIVVIRQEHLRGEVMINGTLRQSIDHKDVAWAQTRFTRDFRRYRQICDAYDIQMP